MSFALEVQVGREPGPPGAITIGIAHPLLLGFLAGWRPSLCSPAIPSVRAPCSPAPTRGLSEAARVHHARRRRGRGVAARGPRAAGFNQAPPRRPAQSRPARTYVATTRVFAGHARIWLRRRSEYRYRNIVLPCHEMAVIRRRI